LIARATEDQEDKLMKFAYNNGTNGVFNASMQHQFIQHCYVFDQLIPIMALASIAFAISSVVWAIIVFHFRKEQSFPVQKILLFVPSLLSLENLLFYLEDKSCPWVSTNVAEDAYLKMGKVTSVTFTYTFLHALFYMLCKGWNTTSQAIDRNQATYLTLVMGVIYLTYSAYFLSSDFDTMTEFINFTLAVIYAVLGVQNYKSLQDQLKIIRMLRNQADEAIPVAFLESISLKKKMLIGLKWVLILFFLPRFLLYSYTFMNAQDEFASEKL
jgi:hypothetical protein